MPSDCLGRVRQDGEEDCREDIERHMQHYRVRNTSRNKDDEEWEGEGSQSGVSSVMQAPDKPSFFENIKMGQHKEEDKDTRDNRILHPLRQEEKNHGSGDALLEDDITNLGDDVRFF